MSQNQSPNAYLSSFYFKQLHTEVNGYTFCSGLNKLKLPNDANLSLQGLIRSVTHLLRGAVFRSKLPRCSSGRLSLVELIDMYHTRKATERRDKEYALLGMSSDDSRSAGLLPVYTIAWNVLFQRLAKYVFV